MIFNRGAVHNSSGRVHKAKPLLPPVDALLPLVRRPCLAVAIGPTGETVLARAAVLAGMRPFLPLTSWRTAASWRDAVAAVLRHPGTDCRIDGGNRIEVVVVGSPDEIACAWPDLRERLQDVGAEAAVAVVTLEVGRAAKAGRDGALPEGCLGRFRVGRVYANGRLTEAEEVGLAARLLRAS